jgi:hypothetical protein
MSEDEVTSIEASAKARDLAGQDSLSDAALPSAERWKLRKYELMEELTSKLRTTLTLTITVAGVVIALLGYLGMTAYIQSVFREKIEHETKRFDTLREDITKREKNLYADQKIFLAVLDKYSQEVQRISVLISLSTNEVNKSEILNLTDMAEFKKSLLNGIQEISNFTMSPDGYKKLKSELNQNFKSTLNRNDFTAYGLCTSDRCF